MDPHPLQWCESGDQCHFQLVDRDTDLSQGIVDCSEEAILVSEYLLEPVNELLRIIIEVTFSAVARLYKRCNAGAVCR